ncbi:hypothetical protein ASPWEDRAFT_542440 [Aspergillus wentii DTO 134E9]|uniref:Uncharacterized protein n=1 Tax=Aspergillus wentii DTO 134E9 TaxID=1073089 RepID=A0A1L9RFR0_ASPWE|nr:uncharacterized protein ASPWEDRAFT_542440 [Aspergillus wentii DTO 134E9]OJJ33750.1 hypothetical protein ASPWEDRAFT_542440 [Aspergillus wentii DTO 134E9]
MNIITPDTAYCLYPKRTLLQRQMQIIARVNLTPSEQIAVQKYEARGWKRVMWSDRQRDAELVNIRYVGDQFTWTVSLPGLDGDGSKKTRCKEETKIGFVAEFDRVFLL